MRIYHIASAEDWAQARRSGRYTTSTRGRTLREEGFIHAAHADQWQRVRESFYADATEPLVLLTIDTDKLTAPVVEERPSGAQERFPHIYGALNIDAVLRAVPLPVLRGEPEPDAVPARRDPVRATDRAASQVSSAASRSPSFSQLFVEEIIYRIALGLGVMVFAGLIGFVAQERYGNSVAFPTTLGALVLGLGVAVWLSRRRDRRFRAERADRVDPSQE